MWTITISYTHLKYNKLTIILASSGVVPIFDMIHCIYRIVSFMKRIRMSYFNTSKQCATKSNSFFLFRIGICWKRIRTLWSFSSNYVYSRAQCFPYLTLTSWTFCFIVRLIFKKNRKKTVKLFIQKYGMHWKSYI